jgi:hypothetical protein
MSPKLLIVAAAAIVLTPLGMLQGATENIMVVAEGKLAGSASPVSTNLVLVGPLGQAVISRLVEKGNQTRLKAAPIIDIVELELIPSTFNTAE